MKGWHDVGKGQRNYVRKGRGAGKMERSETGVFQLECPGRLHGQGIAYGRKGALKAGRRMDGGKTYGNKEYFCFDFLISFRKILTTLRNF